MSARLAPIQEPYEPEVADALRRLMGGADVEPLALFRTIAHHPQLLDRFRAIGSTLLSFGTLAPDERETLIQRTTARCGAGYEWGVHAALFAPALGLGEDWLAATWSGGAGDAAFSERQRTLVRLADALHDSAEIDDELWRELEAGWSAEQIVEALCIAGFYHLRLVRLRGARRSSPSRGPSRRLRPMTRATTSPRDDVGMDLGLDGKVCVVTGASRGIGRETALRLAGEGASVLLVARDEEGLRGVAAECGEHADYLACDVTDADADERIVATCAEQMGGIDVLVNNAGHVERRARSTS